MVKQLESEIYNQNVEFIDLTVSNRAAAAIYGGNADDYQFPTPLVNTIENHLVASTYYDFQIY